MTKLSTVIERWLIVAKFFPKLLRCSEEPVINLLPMCYQIVKKQVNVSNFFCLSIFTFQLHMDQVFIQPLSQRQSQAMTGPEPDRKRKDVDLVPLDAIEVVTVQVKTAIENGRLARLWEKGELFYLVQSPLSL